MFSEMDTIFFHFPGFLREECYRKMENLCFMKEMLSNVKQDYKDEWVGSPAVWRFSFKEVGETISTGLLTASGTLYPRQT